MEGPASLLTPGVLCGEDGLNSEQGRLFGSLFLRRGKAHLLISAKKTDIKVTFLVTAVLLICKWLQLLKVPVLFPKCLLRDTKDPFYREGHYRLSNFVAVTLGPGLTGLLSTMTSIQMGLLGPAVGEGEGLSNNLAGQLISTVPDHDLDGRRKFPSKQISSDVSSRPEGLPKPASCS